jgi:Na+/glutamate symporter
MNILTIAEATVTDWAIGALGLVTTALCGTIVTLWKSWQHERAEMQRRFDGQLELERQTRIQLTSDYTRTLTELVAHQQQGNSNANPGG